MVIIIMLKTIEFLSCDWPGQFSAAVVVLSVAIVLMSVAVVLVSVVIAALIMETLTARFPLNTKHPYTVT